MQIRRATNADIPGLDKCLSQVLSVHANGRPDLFRAGTRKYTDEELKEIIADDDRPIFVAVENNAAPGEILGYGFCVVQDFTHSNNMQPIRSLYIDDICVDENARGKHVGTAIYQHIIDFARKGGFHNVTLNVWECNPGARAFYEAMGMSVQKTCMEQVL
ncbi:MAG: GNAT family N-acetyltransferase [Tractidigestivibacter sp.]|jgi:ribosomal protein S18 acetylase RimI-like enzyme|uniref:GNAT family N-acetyltransferase n=1 Tax=Tractidigestivibacter sp. TaxID=2847320 RepID=UPI003D94A29F